MRDVRYLVLFGLLLLFAGACSEPWTVMPTSSDSFYDEPSQCEFGDIFSDPEVAQCQKEARALCEEARNLYLQVQQAKKKVDSSCSYLKPWQVMECRRSVENLKRIVERHEAVNSAAISKYEELTKLHKKSI